MPDIKLMDPPKEDTQTELALSPRHRDGFQRHIDERVGRVVAEWHKRGKPKPSDPNAPADRITVAKTDVATLKQVIRSAGRLHKHVPVFFRDAKDGNGNTTVKYTVETPPPPQPKPQQNAG